MSFEHTVNTSLVMEQKVTEQVLQGTGITEGIRSF